MNLNARQQKRANRFHTFLKQKEPDYFDFTNITKCEKCKGTGLNAFKNSDGSFSWDCMSYCDDCHGIGYKGLAGGIQISEVDYICRCCDGIGCESCNQIGITDWISHSMGR